MAGEVADDQRGQLMLATGLAICLTLIAIGTDLAQNQPPGNQNTKTSSLGYHMVNLEREFPLALEYRISHNYLHQGAGEETVRELFSQTRVPFQRGLLGQGLACTIELDSITLVGPSRYHIEWTYLLTDDRGQISLSDDLTYTLTATDVWWNTDFPMRYGLEVALPNPERAAPLSTMVNFTALLDRLGETGRFDRDSLRVVAQGGAANQSLDVAAGFLPAQDYSALDNAVGQVVWANEPGYTRYYLYFDVIHTPEPVRAGPKGGGLRVNATGWVTQNAFNWQWEVVNNSHLRIYQYSAVDQGSGGWRVLDQQANWTTFTVQETTDGAVVFDVVNGGLTRRYTVWAGSPVVAWEDLAGSDGRDTGPRTKSFGDLTNGSRDGYSYSIQYRTGAFMATIVPSAASINLTSGGGLMTLASNATSGYLVFGYQGSLAGTQVAEHVANLVNVQFTEVGAHRLGS